MVVVGISGAISSGKDTIGQYLASQYGFIRLGQSDALKEEVAKKFRRTLEAHAKQIYPFFSEDDLDHRIHELLYESRTPLTRALLQEYGTEVRRADDENYWVKRWMERLHAHSRWERIYCPDIRFRNEAEAIRQVGGMLIRVVRDGFDVGSHDSERSMDDWTDWNFVVHNNGSLEDLYEVVEHVVIPIVLKEER